MLRHGRRSAGALSIGHDPRSGKPPSQRQLRVGEQIRHGLAEALMRGDLHEPGLAGVSITVSEVRISPDLKNATAYVTSLGGGDREPVLEALDRALPELRGLIGRWVRLRHTPRLTFAWDDSFDAAQKMAELLRSDTIRRDLETAVREGIEARLGVGDAGKDP